MPEEGQVIPVKVALRCRPLIPKEVDEGCQTCLSFVPGEPQVILGANKSFTYDYIFTPDTAQHLVYETCCASLVHGVFKGNFLGTKVITCFIPLLKANINTLNKERNCEFIQRNALAIVSNVSFLCIYKGYNATVLAYGQTGSGKTFSMGGGYGVSIDTDESIVGVIPRVIRSLFEGIQERKDFNFQVKVSYLEIYKEDLMDLLMPIDKRDKDAVTIREDTGGIKLAGLTEHVVTTVEETMQCLENGSHSRTVGATAMNNSSSRSHAIFTMHIERTHKNDSQDFCRCKFHLVDLAGSERQKKTRAEGERLKEGININKGLLALGNVISALGDEAQRSKHIPYRDSKLTRLLQDSLGGNSHTLMIACVSPADSNMEETLSTLRYADRARKIKNKPIVNRDPQVAEILRLRQLVGDLQNQLLASGKPLIKRDGDNSMTVPVSENLRAIKEKNQELTEQNRSLQQELEHAWEQNEQHCTRIIVLETRKDALQEKLDSLKEKLLSLKKDTPEGEEVAEVVQEMIKQLMEQIDDIERTQNENFENYLHSINESQEGSNSEGEQSQTKLETSENPKSDMDKFTEEMNQKFNERRAQLSRDLGELNKKLHLKQSRVDDMKLSSEMYDKMKGEYEENIKKLNSQIDTLQGEKSSLETQLQQNKAVSNSNKVNENRRKRVQELEAEVSRKKKEVSDANRMLKMKEQTVRDSEKLATEIKALKVQRVQLMKQMKADGEAFRKFKQQKDKEVLQLKAKERKRQVEITKLERQNAQQKNILKRKNEESLALTKRLNEALMKQKKVLEERVKKEETHVGTNKGAMVKKSLSHELEIMIGLQEAKEHKEGLVKDRAEITKHIKQLQDQIRNGSRSNKRRMLNDSSDKETGEDKQKLEKEIRELENELALKNSHINEISSKILELEGDSNEKLKRTRFQDIKTLVDARIGFNYLLHSASTSTVEHRKQKSEARRLKESIDDLSSQLENLENDLEKQRTEHDLALERMQQEHDNKMVFMLKQMQTRSSIESGGSVMMDKAMEERIRFQEKEIDKLSVIQDSIHMKDTNIRDLKKEITRLTYNSRCANPTGKLMPGFPEGNKNESVEEKASFFSPVVLTTDMTNTILLLRESCRKPSINRIRAQSKRVDSIESIDEDEEDYEDEDEEDVEFEEKEDENDDEWQKGYTPGFSQRTVSYAGKKIGTKPPIPKEIHSVLNNSNKSTTSESDNTCKCKGSCHNKRCRCQKIGNFCGDLCDCSSDKCVNRELQLPQSTTDEDDQSQSNMNVTFVKDPSSTNSSTLDSSADLFRDMINKSKTLDGSNKRSLDTSNEIMPVASKYRKSSEAKSVCDENSLPKRDSDVSDSGIMSAKQKKRKLGSKKQFFQPV